MRTKTWRSWAIGVAAFTTACGAGIGCGGDDAGSGATTDGGPDATFVDGGHDTSIGHDTGALADSSNPDVGPDSSEDAGTDTGQTTDAGGDTGARDADAGGDTGAPDADAGGDTGAPDAAAGDAACGAAASACTGGGVLDGLCNNHVCTACVDPTDDSKCATAYGDGGASICSAGSCVAGNCHTSGACAGKVCSAHVCTACTNDTQCTSDPTYGASFVCNTSLGSCVAAACATPNTTCTVNAADECCAVGGKNVCVAGNCCSNAQCASSSPACKSNTCKACDAIANNTYVVDPVNGSDTLGNGSGAAGGAAAAVCAFKTITMALAAIGANPAANTKVNVVGPSTVQAGETFPIVVPVNVTITGITGAVTVSVPITATNGFRLHAGSSGLSNLIVDGTGNTSTAHGILVETGSQTSTTVAGVEVRNFSTEAGIRVQGTGVVTIGAGTSVHNSGSTSAGRAGLHVTGSGIANIASSTGTISFHDNSFAGISVDNGASITINGTPGAGEAGTVLTYSNIGPGIVIAGVPNAGQYPTLSTITGLVSYSNTGDGARFLGGTNVKVRGSHFYGNLIGVSVTTAGSAALAYNDDVSHIDLGSNAATDPGGNVLQSPTTSATLVNANAGLCFTISASKSQTLQVAGNTWASSTGTAALTCTGTSPGAISKTSTCSAGVDLGGNGQTGNTVAFASCN